MLHTLHGKLSASLLGLLCFSGLLIVPLTLFNTQRYLQETTQRLNRPLAHRLAQHLTERNLLLTDAHTRRALVTEIKRLMILNPDIEVYLLDRTGAVVSYSAAPGRVQRARVRLEPVRRFLNEQVPLPLLGDDPRSPTGRKIFSAAPLPVPIRRGVAANPDAYVYIILGGEEYDSVADLIRRSYIVPFTVLLMATVLLLVLATGLYLFSKLTRPLRTLTQAVEGFAHQIALPHPAVAASAHLIGRPRDEIARLGTVFGQMTARIEAQVSELEQADTRRRELISNVSHDLRTPLAALQGYLETLIMKEGSLTADEQRNYLAVATRHGERLTRLVTELFEMANLDAGDIPLHIEPFSPGELIQDVAQKFHLAAQGKKVRLETDFADLPFVCADIGMIEHVLENLLENALRYTPEGGAVTLALALQGVSVVVEVRDTGSGITEQDLPHIFDRHYRAGGQPVATDRSGLGLAIAKRVLELHGGSIEARSAPGQGTTFTFSLPVCPA